MKIDWSACERGNVLLETSDGSDFQAYLRGDEENEWLEISYREENYPSLNVALRSMTDEELAEHITLTFVGWYARKMNLAGVECDEEGYVE